MHESNIIIKTGEMADSEIRLARMVILFTKKYYNIKK